ncbi:2-hydroxyacyl-CoA dehydratase subunit D [Vermiculatibacterium agrestimuris]|uniref:2-hydroxyacyl-CoA dehydratase subunit D n=1 Tax=Vermiculatibacterium agrestimuris TaxID=2941519 RepID=UPI00203C4111|nr:2-hydroxyacyl-CoA dehydratase family protein [Vermiculatibacterium agrestimuris]
MEEKTTQAAAPDAAPKKPKKPLPKSRIMVGEQLAKLYQDTIDAKARGEKIGWSASIFPQEIAEALGLYIVYPENQAAGLAARHQSDDLLAHAEAAGYNMDICSYARTSLAYMDTLTAESNNMPKPDFVLCCNNICNQLTKWFENLAHQFQVPMFLIDTVYNYDPCASDAKVKYVRAQIDDLIHGLEEISGKKMDYDRLTEVMRISQRNKDLWREANELLAVKPAPLAGFDLFNYMSCMVCNRGKESTTAVLEQLISEIKENIAQGKSTFPVEEEYRVFWEGIACWPYLGHTFKTLKKYGINMVATGYVNAWGLEYEPGDLDGLARAYIDLPNNNNNLETVVARRIEAHKKFQVDGTIYHVNRSCKVMDCQQYETQRRISEATGIPFTSFDGDQADFRAYSEAQYETRIQGLVEVMEQRKKEREGGKK